MLQEYNLKTNVISDIKFLVDMCLEHNLSHSSVFDNTINPPKCNFTIIYDDATQHDIISIINENIKYKSY